MKLSFSSYVAAFLYSSVAKNVDAIVADSLAGTDEDVMELAKKLLVADGVEILQASLIGNSRCAGLFSRGSEVDPINSETVPDSGIILSSGDASFLDRDTGSTDNSFLFEEPGDSDLDILAGTQTHDACVLEIEFQCPGGIRGSDVMLKYVFASEDYSLQPLFGYVPGDNDVFGFFLNGENIAVLPLPGEVVPVSVDTVNRDVNSQFFVDNHSLFNANDPYNIAADGFTAKLTAAGPTQAGVNTIKLAIADGDDGELDSWVLLEAGTFTCTKDLCDQFKGCHSKNEDKRAICHRGNDNSDNPTTLCLPAPGIAAHLEKHPGDSCGCCSVAEEEHRPGFCDVFD